MSVESGQTLSHYRLIEKIGEGGMGVVWKALDTKLDREVAVKILPEEVASDPERLSRFEREAKAIAALDHPNIVTVHSVEEADGVHFITMGLVRGNPLTELIPRNGLPLGKFFELSTALADAINAAHQRGITHRDLKPDNVMIDDDGRLKILDFGLAKLREDARAFDGTQLPTATVTQEGKILGTVSYMSPEQAEGKAIDHRSDIFSLGVMLYQMATGQRPFKGDTSVSIISSIIKDTPASVTDIKASLPNHLGRIINRCLAKELKTRYQSTLDLRNELEELGREVATGETTPVKATAVRRPVTKRMVWLAGATIIALLLAVIALQQWRCGRPAEQTPVARPIEAGDAISVAVLPFANMSPNEQNEYFSDGITSEIINYLAKVADLKVIARTSVMQYKDTIKPIRQIGEELGVSSIVEGEVQRVADRVRIRVQLIDAKTEAHLWAETYDRELTNVFAVQSDVTHKIVTALNATLTPSEEERLGRQPTQNLEAYDFYLRGVELDSQSELESDWRMAEQMFVRAVELDPTFAEAHAALSKIHSVLYFYRFDHSEERLAMAREAVDKAQELGVALAEVHSALGYYYYWGLEDYDNALTHFNAARELEPNDSSSISGIAYVQRRQAKLEQTVANLKEAAELDPHSAMIASNIGETYWLMRDFEKAEWPLNRAISLNPSWPFPRVMKAWISISSTGDTAKAQRILDDALKSSGEAGAAQDGVILNQIQIDILQREYGSARERLARLPDAAANHQFAYMPKSLISAEIYRLGGEQETALAHFGAARSHLETKVREEPQDERYHSALGIAYAGLGLKEQAVQEGTLGVELMPVSKDAYKGIYRVADFARILVMVGAYEEALSQLEYLLANPGELTASIIRLDPTWDPLNENPRFQELLEHYDSLDR